MIKTGQKKHEIKCCFQLSAELSSMLHRGNQKGETTVQVCAVRKKIRTLRAIWLYLSMDSLAQNEWETQRSNLASPLGNLQKEL